MGSSTISKSEIDSMHFFSFPSFLPYLPSHVGYPRGFFLFLANHFIVGLEHFSSSNPCITCSCRNSATSDTEFDMMVIFFAPFFEVVYSFCNVGV
jgi:hypothetical protein